MSSVIAIGVAGVAVAGAGVAMNAKAQKDAAKATAANARNPGGEIPLLAQLFPEMAQTARQEDYLSGKQQLALNRNAAWDAIRLTPQLAEAERKATSAQRTDDLRDLRRLGGGIMAELRKAVPGWGQSLDALNSAVSRAGTRTPLLAHLNTEALGAGPSDLRNELQRQAGEELALGGSLSAEDERMAQQTARGAWADRGLGSSNAALIEEVMNRDSVQRLRKNERRTFAGGAVELGIREDAANRDFAMGVEGLNESALGNERALLTNAVGVNQNALGPLLDFLRPRSAVGPAMSAGILSAGPQAMGASNGLLAQLLGYGQDASNTNFNAVESRANARANNGAAIGGAALGAGTQLVGTGAKLYAGQQQQPPRAAVV